MNATPTIVRLLRFPASLRLLKKGAQYLSGKKRSGALILSERHQPVEVTFRTTLPGVSFSTGGTSVTSTEAFTEGEQRDVLLPWTLVVEQGELPSELLLEIDVAYDGKERHTATVPLKLLYGIPVVTVAVGAAIAVAAVAATMVSRRKSKVVAEDREIEISSTPSKARKPSKAASKSAASKKSGAKPAASSSKKASGTRPGSAASQSAPRKDAPGSSKARKSAPRPPKPKSR